MFACCCCCYNYCCWCCCYSVGRCRHRCYCCCRCCCFFFHLAKFEIFISTQQHYFHLNNVLGICEYWLSPRISRWKVRPHGGTNVCKEDGKSTQNVRTNHLINALVLALALYSVLFPVCFVWFHTHIFECYIHCNQPSTMCKALKDRHTHSVTTHTMKESGKKTPPL